MMSLARRLDAASALIPLLATLVFLVSLRSEPGPILFGEEDYPGELRGWGVLLRVFALAAFQNFEHLWTALAYVGIYAYLAPSTKTAEVVEFVLFSVFALVTTDLKSIVWKVSNYAVHVRQGNTNKLTTGHVKRFFASEKSVPSVDSYAEASERVGRDERTPARFNTGASGRSFIRSKSPAVPSSRQKKKKIDAKNEEERHVSDHDDSASPVADSHVDSHPVPNDPTPQEAVVPSPLPTVHAPSQEATQRVLQFEEVPSATTRKDSVPVKEQSSPAKKTPPKNESVEDAKRQARLEQQRRTEERLNKIKVTKKKA